MSLFSRLFPKEEDGPEADAADGTIVLRPEDVTREVESPDDGAAAAADQTEPFLLLPVRPDGGAAVPPPMPAQHSATPARNERPAPPVSVSPIRREKPARPASAPERRPVARTPSDVAADLAALHATFEDLAIDHVRPVRTLMLELRWRDAPASWIDLARPALRSLRSMAGQVELPDLCTALDGFAGALDATTRAGQSTLAGPVRQALLAAYAPLAETLPRAFALDGVGNPGEPIIVQGLLRQVPSLDPLMIERLCAAGLGRLDALMSATAEDLTAVAGLPEETALAVVAAVDKFRHDHTAASSPAGAAARDGATALSPLVAALEAQHRAYQEAAQGWSEERLAAKRRLRRGRTGTWLQITVTLARLGAIDWLERLEPLPFARKLEELARYLRQLRSLPASPRSPFEAPASS
jgi:hypothetical protein